MGRVTTSSSQQSDQWVEDQWYSLELERVDRIEPKGTAGYQGQPRRHARVTVVWKLPETDEWLFDNFDLTVNSQKDGTPSTCKQLICALAQRNHLATATPWIDDETLEFGFDEATANVEGRIEAGVRIAARGKWGKNAKGEPRFNIEKYVHPSTVQIQGIQAPPPPPQRQLSPDGRWEWDGQSWKPIVASTLPPPAVQQELI